MAVLHYAIFTALVCGSLAQVTRPGPCPAQEVVNPFNVAAYLGKWYQIEAYFQVFSANAICVAANYSDLGNGTVKVYNTQFNGANLEFTSIEGTARLVNGTAAQLGVSFPVAAGEAPYWVLDTDYVNYSVVWACRDFGGLHFETVWFLARERQPNSLVQDQVKDILAQRQINTDDLIVTRQYDCPEEPQPGSGY